MAKKEGITKAKSFKVDLIKTNPNNPRVLKDEKFKKLVQSIKDFPQMLALRPLILDEDNIVLGGNMRLKAIKQLGYKEIPLEWVKFAVDLTEDEKKQFIIKDNVGFGEWDWDTLIAEWDEEKVKEWGLDIWKTTADINLEEFFQEHKGEGKEEIHKIILEYTKEEFEKVTEALKEHTGRKEAIFYKLLGL